MTIDTKRRFMVDLRFWVVKTLQSLVACIVNLDLIDGNRYAPAVGQCRGNQAPALVDLIPMPLKHDLLVLGGHEQLPAHPGRRRRSDYFGFFSGSARTTTKRKPNCAVGSSRVAMNATSPESLIPPSQH